MLSFKTFVEGSEDEKSEKFDEKLDTDDSEKTKKELAPEEKRDESTEKVAGRESPIRLTLEEDDSINEEVNIRF